MLYISKNMVLACLALLIILQSCTTGKYYQPAVAINTEQSRDFDLEHVYRTALRAIELSPSNAEALQTLKDIIVRYPGTKFASLATLRLSENLFWQGALYYFDKNRRDIESLYRSFIIINPGHQLIPYVLSNLSKTAYVGNESLIYDEYTSNNPKSIFSAALRNTKEFFLTEHANPEPYKKNLEILRSFQIIYPDSIYYDEVLFFAQSAKDKLAEVEERIGDWYAKQKIYTAAANRYERLLEYFPTYKHAQRVSKKLIDALKNNLMLETALKYEKSYAEIYGSQEN